MEEVAVLSGLVLGQFLCAGNSAMLNYLQNLGLPSSSIVIFSSIATFLLLSPPSIYFERDKWPKKPSFKLLVFLVLVSLGGVTLFQSFLLKGMKLTSPTMANALQNLSPAIIFVIAIAFSLEKVKLENIYTKVKIAGTLLCVSGAVTMSIFKSATQITNLENIILDSDKIIGCLYLVASSVSLSFAIVLQALILIEYQAPVSLCAITAIIGVFIASVIELVTNHKVETGLLMVNSIELIGYYLLVGTINGSMISINLWAMKKKGPVFVSMFSPLSAVISAFISYFTLGETFSIGRLMLMKE
ncbi:WAT1-related protein At5g47470-like isoform X2 [Impatiens glandulifera]|uniref:WAT1-related protein At5g47470-like isoform X2 n=1 Tax=Impatiens glandulifera TaxID=253017 RepID=UPI001FB05178|nr:WAT1-related protein At5g47470-like isoform X2 [Impatiens glandulifera]